MKVSKYTRPEEYEVAIFRDIMVPMRDGVKLSTDLYLPCKNGVVVQDKFTAILDRTPYFKLFRIYECDNAHNCPEYFTKRGYAFVFQDERGHGDSEGEFNIFVNAGRDGYDAVNWIAKQSWSNGVVLTSGYSYDAATQESLARESPPNLSGMFLGFGHANYHQDTAGTNGAFRLAHNLNYTLQQARLDNRAGSGSTIAGLKEHRTPNVDVWLAECEKNVTEWFRLPLSKQLECFRDIPMAKKWYSEWINHQDYDDYWKQNGYSFEGFHDKCPDIPTYYFGGWWDLNQRGSVKNFVEVSKIHRSPTFLMMGPWTHGPHSAVETWAGDVDFGPDSAVDWTEERLRFYDHFIMGKDTGLLNKPRVKVFVMGGGSGRKNGQGRLEHGGRWRFEESWPFSATQFTNYYLHVGGELSTQQQTSAASPSTYSFDPTRPVPQIGGGYTHPWIGRGVAGASGPWDQTCREDIIACRICNETKMPLSARPDVLTFQTSPLSSDVEVVGPLIVDFWASSSAVDTDFTAKLMDVYPPSDDYPSGYAMYLIDSIIRARYRDSYEKQTLMKPGQIYKFTMDLWNTANLFKAGHRIRLDMSSSNFPTYDVNPNTGERIGYHTRTEIAKNSIYLDEDHPSKV
ncbi:MAG: CocE/NonD family hydrolase, partial [Candidatus Bathyarchaeia archaeon]